MIIPRCCPQSQMLAICMHLLLLIGFFMASSKLVIADQNTNLSYSSVANTETVKIGNTKTNNYNIQGSSFLPTQLTQVVLNVPKIGKKLRRTRQPTLQEMAIKNRILEIYDRAHEETANTYSVHLEHLGRIIRALNPKYIATERVRLVVSADPRDANSLIPLPEFNPILVKLDLADGSPLDKLNLLVAKFNELVSWDENIVEQFAGLPDESLEAGQIALKRVILCLSGHPLCAQPAAQPVDEEPAIPVAAASAASTAYSYPISGNEFYMPPQEQQQPNDYYYPQHLQVPHDRMPVSNQRPKFYIPEEVKQRYYARQQARPNKFARRGAR